MADNYQITSHRLLTIVATLLLPFGNIPLRKLACNTNCVPEFCGLFTKSVKESTMLVPVLRMLSYEESTQLTSRQVHHTAHTFLKF